MKLVFASQGFTTSDIANAVAKLVNKPFEDINISIINEAYVGLSSRIDKKWLINELSLITKYFKGHIDFINLRAYDINETKERVKTADIIYIVGGKQFVLPKLFKQTGFDMVLKELAKDKVIMGTSAAANLLGKPIENKEYWKVRYKKDIKEEEQLNLKFVDFNIVPHYMRKDREKYDKEYYNKLLCNNSFPIYALKDEQAIIWDNNKIYFIGGEAIVLSELNK